MSTPASSIGFRVVGGELHALRLGSADPSPRRTVLAAHGITASAMSWPAVAAALPDDWAMIALDLRGRGGSRDLPRPTGLRQHAADVCAVAEQLDAGDDLVLVGHSMGAFVATLAAHQRPELFGSLVLVDGGVPLPLPPGTDPDELLAAILGPALSRLRQTYPSVEAYLDFYRAHPALGPHWSEVVEEYVRYDAVETPDGVRASTSDEAARSDGRDVLVLGEELDAALRGLRMPTRLLTAPLGMMGDPPGLLPADAVAMYAEEVDVLSAETVPDANHYTILFEKYAAAQVAAAITGR